jgi:hypothetical protein
MKVGDLVREWIDRRLDARTGIVIAIDPLRRGKVGTAGDTCVEIVILLMNGLQTYADPRRWEVISESR